MIVVHILCHWQFVLQPMLAHVRVHPLLVTATKEKELLRERFVVGLYFVALFTD